MHIIKKHKGIINILDMPQQWFVVDHTIKKNTTLANATSYIVRMKLPHHQITLIIIVKMDIALASGTNRHSQNGHATSIVYISPYG
jgi:hypothetical protein